MPSLRSGGLYLICYIIGVLLSPYLLPIDYFVTNTSTTTAAGGGGDGHEFQEFNGHASAYKEAIAPADADERVDNSDPFHNVDIVLHRNGEPDPCIRQQQLQQSMSASSAIQIVGDVVRSILQRVGITVPSSTAENNDNKMYNDSSSFTFSPLSKSLLRSAELLDTASASSSSALFNSKYYMDAMLTNAFVMDSVFPLPDIMSSCGPTPPPPNTHRRNNNKEGNGDNDDTHYLDTTYPQVNYNTLSSMIKYCDAGVTKTPIMPDHNELIRVPYANSLPCHFHTREGVRVTSLKQLAMLAREVSGNSNSGSKDEKEEGECMANYDDTDQTTCKSDDKAERKELHLYAVPAGRVFMFAPKYIGEIIELPHVKGPEGLPVSLEVMSLHPRVFDIYNFFDKAESAAIVNKALKETSETHRMKRSTTGASGYNLNSKRTSENGFDTHGKEAMVVKRRCMDILGFDTYVESLTDGLQVLRYNLTTGYYPHMDWIDDHYKREEHNFDSAGVGSNRFATILLYMSDLEEGDGGETLFSKGWPVGQAEEDRVSQKDAIKALRDSGDVDNILERGSWEEEMVADCRTRLAIRPHSARAVLFYSQNPDGTPDSSSLHGGCPVIKGEKWAANLWVWNAPRGGFEGSPVNQDVVDKNRAANSSPDQDMRKHATFYNTKKDERMRHASLYFQETFWGKYGFDDPPLSVNTFEGHQWNVIVDDKVVKTFTVGKDKNQEFNI